mgnify:CR=1 FL=1
MRFHRRSFIILRRSWLNLIKKDKVLSLIGMANRAGKVVSGEFLTEKAVKSGKGYLTIVAGDASDNTKKNFTDMCAYYRVPIEIYGTKEELGRWTGKIYRASICILDEGFAKALMKKIRLNMEV